MVRLAPDFGLGPQVVERLKLFNGSIDVVVVSLVLASQSLAVIVLLRIFYRPSQVFPHFLSLCCDLLILINALMHCEGGGLA